MPPNTRQTEACSPKSAGGSLPAGLRLLAVLILGVAVAIATTTPPRARAAASEAASRTVNVTDGANLHRTSETGATIVEEGDATGALPGRVKSQFKVGATVSATAVLFVRSGGTISIRCLGVLHSSGVSASFSGTMSAIGGTGAYAHARGSGGFYGVVNRRSWTVQMHITGYLTR